MQKIRKRSLFHTATAGLLGMGMLSCAAVLIEGTQVKDTDENRAIYSLVKEVERCLEERDADGLLALVSDTYFEDMGTASAEDDYGYHELTKLLPESMAVTAEVHVAFKVQDISVQGDQAYADLRYNSRARLRLASGSRWDTHKEFNRIEFTRQDGVWKIVSGL